MPTTNDGNPDLLGGRGYPRQSTGYNLQLEMVRGTTGPVALEQTPAGYSTRQYESHDRDAYLDLFHLAFEVDDPLPDILGSRLDAGFFVVEHQATGALVASCVAQEKPRPRYPEGGELGWLVTDPAHSGRGLGSLVASAVTNRLVEKAYWQVYLLTDDFRLPAISIYLKLGWQPNLFEEGMEDRCPCCTTG